MPKVKRINHVAMLVDDLDKTLAFWRDTLGMELGGVQEVPAEQALTAFLRVGESEIELVQPMTADSSLARFLEKRGPGMHHVCLEVDDIEGMLAILKDKGIELINETPMVGSQGKKYAFIHPRGTNGVLIELYELPG